MAEDTVESLRAQLATAHARIKKTTAAALRFRSERDELAAGFEGLEEEYTEYRTASESTPAAKKYAELQSKLHAIEARKAFDAAAPDLKPGTAEAAWKLLGFTPTGTDEDADAMAQALDGLRESSPFLFGPADAKGAAAETATTRATTPPAGPGPGFTRGASARPSGAFPYTREQMQDPSFMTRNAEAVSKALADRNAAATAV